MRELLLSLELSEGWSTPVEWKLARDGWSKCCWRDQISSPPATPLRELVRGNLESSDFTPAASLPPFKLSPTTTSCVLIYRMLPSSILRQGAVSYITRSQFHDALLHACPSLADASPLRPPKLGRGYRLFSTTI